MNPDEIPFLPGVLLVLVLWGAWMLPIFHKYFWVGPKDRTDD